MKTSTLAIIFLVILGLLSFWIIMPYLSYIFFAAIIVFISFPLYKKLRSKLKNKALTASIIIACIFILFIIPIFFMIFEMFVQVKDIFTNLQVVHLENIAEKISSFVGFNVSDSLTNFSSNIISYVVSNIFKLTRAVANLFIGLFIMVFTMFYLYVDGEIITSKIKKMIPAGKKYQDYIINHAYQVMQALLLGIFATAFIQGIFGGIGFVIFGMPNAIFWGFVLAFASLIPFLGAHIVYIPASIYLMYKGNVLAGTGLLIYSIIVVSNLDNFIRPKIVRTRIKIHPLVVILGIIGGIAVFGVVGMILGPLVLSLFLEMLNIYKLIKKRR